MLIKIFGIINVFSMVLLNRWRFSWIKFTWLAGERIFCTNRYNNLHFYCSVSVLVENKYIRQILTKKGLYFCYAMKVINL